jgi:hypothetical protein
VVGARDAFPVGQGLLVQGDRLVGAARVLVGDGEMAARFQGVGVIGAQCLFLVSQQPLADHDALRCRPDSSGTRLAAI